MRYADEEGIIDTPGIKIHGIDDFYFNIEMQILSRQAKKHTHIPAKVTKRGNKAIFSAEGSETEYDLRYFHKYYRRYFVNSLIEKSHSTSVVPTFRKNKWESRNTILNLKINKRFWSKVLHVDPRDISYGLVRAKNYEPYDPDRYVYIGMVPVLKVKGVTDYYFGIRLGIFFTMEEFESEFMRQSYYDIFLTEYVPAKITHSKNKIVFTAKSGEKTELPKADVYRQYMTRIVNSSIL